MQDRSYHPATQFRPDEAPVGLQEAIRQLGGLSWEKRGSAVIVNTGLRFVRFGIEMLERLKIHQGYPEAIAELIEENRRSSTRAVRAPTKTGTRKPGFGSKTIR